MREILFRGRRSFNGEWVYGSLIHIGDFCCILEKDQGRLHPLDQAYLDPDLGNIDGYATKVQPETVGQFTGLLDKDGKKIFEGDIVTSKYYLERDKMINSVIEYGEWNCGCCNGVYGWVSNGSVDFGDDDVIVIGNIHDNPELLKERY